MTALLIKEQIKEMSFSSLLEHLKTQLNILERSNNKAAGSKDELLDLCDVLDTKILDDYQNVLSAYSNPPDQYPSFVQSDHLRALIDKRSELKKRLPGGNVKKQTNQAKKRAIRIYDEMAVLSDQIKTLLVQEIGEHKKQRDEHEYHSEVEIKKYLENKKKVELVERERKYARYLSVEEVRHKILKHFDLSKVKKVHKIKWRILPPGKWSMEQITNHFKSIEHTNSASKYDLERLKLLETLKPTTCYIGLEEFVGYVVFCFDHTDKTIFENPIKGNAIYIICGNWEEMSKLTKRDLLSHYSDRVKKIVHRGNWFKRLQMKLKDRMATKGTCGLKITRP